ncbi:DNA repair protein RadC [Fontibacillus panacisegetis]|uniref:DNA repair protein RadC n=2 Tax=Paenibacillaceae TaxID=186822 RepID=A0A1G7HT03_9BACL|nr:DNA repair protein RadC [Fontibacillus panacisegetis]SDF03570.1 DNA repair protein RadC [Fontibacillus panacisegetis]
MCSEQKEDIIKLLAQILRDKHDNDEIGNLLDIFPTRAELINASEQQLTSIKGIGKKKALQIYALIQLAKSITIQDQKNCIIRTPQDVFKLLEAELCHEQKEHFICLFLNTKNRLIFKETISIGSLNAAIVHPREVFHAAIRRCSASLICAHNHPSGDPEPSMEDINLTKRLIAAGEIIGIEVLDHVIIGGNRFYSLKEHGHF